MLNDITNVARSETMEYGRWTVYWTGISPTAEYSIFIGILQYITRLTIKRLADCIECAEPDRLCLSCFKDGKIGKSQVYFF